MGSPPSALGLLAPARYRWARRAARSAQWALSARRWPEPRRAAGAVALAALDGAWAALLRPQLSGLLAVLGALALLAVLAGVLARRLRPVTVGLGLLGAEYMVSQAGRAVSVVVAAAFGAVLLAVAEMAWWSAELAARSLWARRELRRRWAVLAGLVGGSFALGVVVGVAGVAQLRPAAAVAVAGAVGGLVVALAVATWVRDLSGGSPARRGGRNQ